MIRIATANDHRLLGKGCIALLDMRGEWEMPIYSLSNPLLSATDRVKIKQAKTGS